MEYVEYFKNGYKNNTPIPKAMWWYICEHYNKETPVNCELCNHLLNNELKIFFKKYPEELYNKVLISSDYSGRTNITKEDIQFYKNNIGE